MKKNIWFAWYPVSTNKGLVWLKLVERTTINSKKTYKKIEKNIKVVNGVEIIEYIW